MFTALRDTVGSLIETSTDIKNLLAEKLRTNTGELTNADEVDYLPLLQKSDLLSHISQEIDRVDALVDNVNGILDAAETYLEQLVDYVPHYDEVTALSFDTDEDPDEVDDDFEPYAQVYLDNLLENVTPEELEHYTSDNGKIVLDCRKFIPNATALLNILLQMFQQLESLLNNDDFINNIAYICCGRINTFATHFTQFVATLNM